MYFYKHVVIIFILFTFICDKIFSAQKFGLEFEYAIHGELTFDEIAPLLLKEVHSNISNSKNEFHITRQRWSRFNNLNLYHYSYVDLEGRTWEVVPEVVNSQNYDGVELITPPLQEQDLFKLKNLRHSVKKLKKLKRGIHSSGHITLDVSHLIKNDNYNEVINLILFVESRWPELYAYFNPKRLGHMVNYYSVPLALDQQELLIELSNLNPDKRTFENIRKIFLKYEEREIKLKNNDGYPMFPWKFRAANYAKLFALAGNQETKVIEIRLDDLDLSDRLENKITQLLALIGKDYSSRVYFENRLNSKLRWYEAENEMVGKFRLEIFEDLANALQLSPNQKKTIILDLETKKNIVENVDRLFADNNSIHSTGHIEFKLSIEFTKKASKLINKKKLLLNYPDIIFSDKKIIITNLSKMEQLLSINKNIIIPNEHRIRRIDFQLDEKSKNKNNLSSLVEMMKWVTPVTAENFQVNIDESQLITSQKMNSERSAKVRILSNFSLAIFFSVWILSQDKVDNLQKINKKHTLASLIEGYVSSNKKEKLSYSEIELLNKIEINLLESYLPLLTDIYNWRNLYPSERVRLRDATFQFSEQMYHMIKAVDLRKIDFNIIIKEIRFLNLMWFQRTDFINLFMKRAMLSNSPVLVKCESIFN